MNIIVSNRSWNRDIVAYVERELAEPVAYIENEELVTYETLRKFEPNYIFFPHWSHIIPPGVYESFACVVFHMTDLPFGRGGSPLQNLIARGIYETKISALRCCKELDAGDIYLKEPLSLHGNAEEIYIRAGKVIREMIVKIVREAIIPQEQCGEIVSFKRRKPEEGDIAGLQDLDAVYDYIRMLDAEGYPRAFLDTGAFRLEFSRAARKSGCVVADVKITLRNNVDE